MQYEDCFYKKDIPIPSENRIHRSKLILYLRLYRTVDYYFTEAKKNNKVVQTNADKSNNVTQQVRPFQIIS